MNRGGGRFSQDTREGPLTRREAALALLALSAAPFLACRRGLECTDTSQLSAADLQLRVDTLRYTDESPDPKQHCAGCQQFKPRGDGACGACVVVRGPINPQGRCKRYAAKPA